MDIKQRVKKDALLGAGLTIEEEEAHDVKNDIVQVKCGYGVCLKHWELCLVFVNVKYSHNIMAIFILEMEVA